MCRTRWMEVFYSVVSKKPVLQRQVPASVFFRSGDRREHLDALLENGMRLFQSFVDPVADEVSLDFQTNLTTVCDILECKVCVKGIPDGVIRSGEDVILYELKCSKKDDPSHEMQALLYAHLYAHTHGVAYDKLKVCVVNVVCNTIRWIRVKDSCPYSAIFEAVLKRKLLSTSSVRSRKRKRRSDDVIHWNHGTDDSVGSDSEDAIIPLEA